MSNQLVDKFGRKIDYLRLSVTDRCNLRCFYCMPEHGIEFLSREALLSYEEMLRIVGIFHSMGIDKVRITGGEPFVRKDLIYFLEECRRKYPKVKITMTTNGILTGRYLEELLALGITSINLSLDTLDSDRFKQISRRDEFSAVMETFEQLLSMKFSVKVNAVVMDGVNTQDILPMAEMTVSKAVSMRFIEEMPFNGSGLRNSKLIWNYKKIHTTIEKEFPGLIKLNDPENSTAYHYKIPNSLGNIGIIAAYSRTFCGSCNRVRLTAEGVLRNCLYSNGGLDLKQLVRSGYTDDEITARIRHAVQSKKKDGWETEKARQDNPVSESMSSIGG